MRCSTPVPNFDYENDDDGFDTSCAMIDASNLKANENSQQPMDIDELCNGIAAMKQSQ